MLQEYWPHQIEAAPRLVAGHYMLAWEPGTGKTIGTLLAFSQVKMQSDGPVRMLVIVPANTRYQWLFAAEEYGFDTQLIERTAQKVDPLAEVVIVSYHGIVAKGVWASAMALSWDVLTLDEAHYCKTPSTKWTKAIFGARKNSPACLFTRAKRCWMLTGTPIMNDPSELWVFASRVFPALLTDGDVQNRKQWTYRWCKGYETPYGFKVTGARDAAKLNEYLQPYMSRVKKSVVLVSLKDPLIDTFRLPPRKIKMPLELDPVLQRVMAILGNDDPDLDALDADPQVATLRRIIGKEKAGEVAELVKGELICHDKVIVFYLHTDCGEHILQMLHADKIGAVIYNGRMTPVQKQRNKEAFINDPDCQVIVIQIQAGGTGTDGLQIAQRVIIAEPPYTPGLMDQIISRAHRGGQQGQVHATTVVISGSFDDRVVKMLERKGRMINQVIDGVAA